MDRTGYPRHCDGPSPVHPCGDRSLLAGMGVLVDLHGRISPHDGLSDEKGPGASSASHEWRSDGREATSTKVHHAVYVNWLHSPSCRTSVRPPLWVVRRAARHCCGGRRSGCDWVLSHFPGLSRKHLLISNHSNSRESEGYFD